jgi:hypothetical protein
MTTLVAEKDCILQGLSFVVYLNMVALSHRRPASNRESYHTCCVQESNKRWYNVCNSQKTQLYLIWYMGSFTSTTCFGLYIGHHQVVIMLLTIQRTIQYSFLGVVRGERDLVLQLVGGTDCWNLGWSLDLRCGGCRGVALEHLCADWIR